MAEEQGKVYEDCDVIAITRDNGVITMSEAEKKVINEVTLKIFVGEQELVSVICLNRQHEELALGLLYNEGVIDSMDDIQSIEYIERMTAVMIRLRDGVVLDRRETLRSITASCGKCYTYINPLKRKQYHAVPNGRTYPAGEILLNMEAFVTKSELYKAVGGTHSVQFSAEGYEVLIDDLGRHNCFDKITGILLKENKLELAAGGIVFVSGRLTSEMLLKMIRLGVPVAVSKSSPSTAAIQLAREWGITILGYVKGGSGVIYTCPERITPA
jgi:FdhD protein